MRVNGDKLLGIRFGDMISGSEDHGELPLTENLPEPTRDMERARRDFSEFGYCLIRDAMSHTTVAAVRRRLIEQAQGEAALGIGLFDGGPDQPNQRLWSLINKGQEFLDLLLNPIIPQMCIPFLGEGFLLGAYSANIARRGGEPQMLHYDQATIQPPLPFRTGLTCAWFLDDVSVENGGTRLVPGSHRWSHGPKRWSRGPVNPYATVGTVAASGPAGTDRLGQVEGGGTTGKSTFIRSRPGDWITVTQEGLGHAPK